MAQTEPLPGWLAPVRQSLAEPRTLLMLGIPPIVCGGILMGTIVTGIFWWRSIFLGALAYAIALIGTAYEVQWWDMVKAYWRYATTYEG